MSTSGFVIAGEGVQAASVRLQRSVRSEKKLVAELQKLKSSGINEENSFAFMFACCGRGENHYRGRVGLEANTFVKMFPRTPLVGLFGNGGGHAWQRQQTFLKHQGLPASCEPLAGLQEDEAQSGSAASSAAVPTCRW